ncbi:YheC/YheD family endospore coat-associated protein [Thermaerobacillus caldiproteolyticus]|uniref:YheC/YheD family endospore coat-associated protein n=1 Tax=Thermaerobacillus caldiproteolyticus TaxID=247480 RepID=UPI00188B1567|nr:YheC/YheD family protein [Anoxybacillus caldiproteolyticus]QPA31546.1 YheC/YheD family protein [Anoxybacillus caldiproteolyticus]
MNIYALTIQNHGENTVWLPSTAPLSGQTDIAFGSVSTSCQIVSSSALNNEIIVTKDVAERLRIPFANRIHLFLDEDTIYIGPLIGIFTAGFTKSSIRPIGKRSFFFAKLLSNEKKVGGFAFVFGAHHIHWDKGTVTGYFYTKTGWEQHEIPFPNVIYNRLPNRRTENETMFQEIKQKLKTEYFIPWFNENFFNKWDIYCLLQQHPLARAYLPDTASPPTIEAAQQFLDEYQQVYIKPANGSLGLGIYQLIQRNNSYYCRFRDHQGCNRLQKFPTLSDLWGKLLADKNMELYILQQGIPLIEVNGRKVDFRIHTNKDEHGIWQVSAIAAKIAGKGSVTTHINNGGIVKTVEEVFPKKEEQTKMTERLQHAALTLSRCLEEQLDMMIGEIGFDIGIDQQNNLWLFEANSKPGRSIFKHPKLKQYDELTTVLSLEYAVYLSKQMITAPEALLT